MTNIEHFIEYCACEGVAIKIEKHLPDKLNQFQMASLDLEEILRDYCLCEEQIVSIQDFMQTSQMKIENTQNCQKTKKKLNLERKDFRNNLKTLIKDLEKLPSSIFEIINGKGKSRRKYDRSFRRSCYTGVSRNGPNWQTLIAINKRKTYVGTFETEEEAARAYDFYSLLLHSISARTNFSYTKEEVLNMIEKHEIQMEMMN